MHTMSGYIQFAYILPETDQKQTDLGDIS